MDRSHLRATLPAFELRELTGLRVLGVDEVARAKGHEHAQGDLPLRQALYLEAKNFSNFAHG